MVNLEFILSQFDIPGNVSMQFEQDGKNGLSFVYFIDKKYVLRWRPLFEKTYEDFANERMILGEITPYIKPIRVPEFFQTKWGEYYFTEENILWSLTLFIPGDTLCGISDVSMLTEANKKLYMEWLFEFQQKTNELKQEKSHYKFISWVEERYRTVQNYFTPEEQWSIQKALSGISRGEGEMCFVHGDYHPGNILIDTDKNIITGLIDLDWCHVWSIYEDLSLIILSIIRDISQTHFVYSEATINDLLVFYPWQIDFQKLKKYILLRSVHDLSFFTPRPWGWMDKMKETQLEIIRALIST